MSKILKGFKNFFILSLVITASLFGLQGCVEQQPANPPGFAKPTVSTHKGELENFSSFVHSEQETWFVIKSPTTGVVTGAYYKYDIGVSGINQRITAYFYPVPSIRIYNSADEKLAFDSTTYIYSQAPAELKIFWDVLYESAIEDATAKGYTVAKPLTGEVASTKKYEDKIAELEARIVTLIKAEASMKTAMKDMQQDNAAINNAAAVLTAERNTLQGELIKITAQRDKYKESIDKFTSSLPKFD